MKNKIWILLLPLAVLLLAAAAENKYNGQFTGTFYGNGSGLTNLDFQPASANLTNWSQLPTNSPASWIQASNLLACWTPFTNYNTAVVVVVDPTNSNLQFVQQTNASGLTIAISTNARPWEFASITLDISNNTAQTLTFLTTNLYSSFTYNATNNDVGTVLFWKPAYSSNNLWRAKQLQ